MRVKSDKNLALKDCSLDCNGLTLKDVNSKIRNAVNKGLKITLLNAEHLSGIASGLRLGDITIKGNANDYVGLLNSGAKIVVEGDVGDFIGDNSWGGEIIVKGNSGYGTDIYSYGGSMVIYGDADDAAGQIFKGGILLIGGDVGANVGLYMVGGEIVIVGNTGEKLGDFMIRGTIYLGGKCDSLGNNARYEQMNSEDLNNLSQLLKKYEIDANLKGFKKIVPVSKKPFA